MTDFYIAFRFPDLMIKVDPAVAFAQNQKDFCYALWSDMWGPTNGGDNYWYERVQQGVDLVKSLELIHRSNILRNAEGLQDAISTCKPKIHER